MKRILLLILALVILGCVQQPITEQPIQTSEQQVQQQEAAKQPEVPEEVVVVRCVDIDGGNEPYKEGKAVVYYSDDTKESFDDKCIDEDLGFQLEYVCEGTVAKTKNNHCSTKCERGVCS
jgi:hypothetical protein